MKNLKQLIAALFLFIVPMISKTQNIITVAGNGDQGFGGDGFPATSMYTEFYSPYDVFIDQLGNIYVADTYNQRIREINTSGIISTIAGDGTEGYGGDGGPATAAYLNFPHGVYVDKYQNIYISDVVNNAVRKIDVSGTISTIAGRGKAGFSGDGGPATAAELYNPWSICTDDEDNIYIADEMNQRIRKINSSGIISTIAGNGIAGYGGDGGLADTSKLWFPISIIMDGSNLLIADYSSQRIRKINSSGIISTIAGNGFRAGGSSGDGGPATAAELYGPFGVCKDISGNIYISDNLNYKIRMVNTSGIISTIAGDGIAGYTGDGGPATLAEYEPAGICTDNYGNVYDADGYDVIREIVFNNPTGIENGIGTNSVLNLFPNPANKFINLITRGQKNDGLTTLSIMDITGREVITTTYKTNTSMELDITSLTSGMYFLSVIINSTWVTKKFIKL